MVYIYKMYFTVNSSGQQNPNVEYGCGARCGAQRKGFLIQLCQSIHSASIGAFQISQDATRTAKSGHTRA